MAVSYTHLDVYKRQTLVCVAEQASAFVGQADPVLAALGTPGDGAPGIEPRQQVEGLSLIHI